PPGRLRRSDCSSGAAAAIGALALIVAGGAGVGVGRLPLLDGTETAGTLAAGAPVRGSGSVDLALTPGIGRFAGRTAPLGEPGARKRQKCKHNRRANQQNTHVRLPSASDVECPAE